MAKDQSWLVRQNHDPFRRKASVLHFRSRAIFKLQELNALMHFIEKSDVIIDIGSSPGGWSQYITARKALCGQEYKLIALDKRPMQNINRAEFILGGFELREVQKQVASKLNNRRADLILSDVCPNISGNREFDRFHSLDISKNLLKFSEAFLKRNGKLLLKTFSGISGKVCRMFSERFREVQIYKPHASRHQSSEVFVFCNSRVVDGNRTHGIRSHNSELYH